MAFKTDKNKKVTAVTESISFHLSSNFIEELHIYKHNIQYQVVCVTVFVSPSIQIQFNDIQKFAFF